MLTLVRLPVSCCVQDKQKYFINNVLARVLRKCGNDALRLFTQCANSSVVYDGQLRNLKNLFKFSELRTSPLLTASRLKEYKLKKALMCFLEFDPGVAGWEVQTDSLSQGTLTVGGSITVQLVSSLTRLDLTIKENMLFLYVVKQLNPNL